jgi:glycosyltransferase involved in cell wall biosynthesis
VHVSDVPRILAVTPGPPFAPETFSGSSAALLHALERHGALARAVDGRAGAITFAERAASFAPDMERWKQRANAGASFLSPLARRAMSAVSARRARAALDGADTILQMTGYFDPGRPRAGVLRCSYHDGNLAGFLRRPDLKIDAGGRFARWSLAYERRLYDSIDVIFCMSEQLRRSFISDFGQDEDKVVTVGAGANVATAEVPARDYSPPRFLFVGKQWERKGGPVVLSAFARLHEEIPEAELIVAGPQSLSVDVPGVELAGRVARDGEDGAETMAALYRRATAFVMPSLYEPLGVAVLEAMAAGLPCIASTGGALPELIEEGVTGHLVPPGDEDALLARMRELALSPERCRALGDAGAARYRERFTWDAVAERMLAAISSRRAPRTDR